VIPPRFTVAEADSAYEEWGCNCGPTAIAAIMGLTLDELRPHLGDFERKRYTNPTLMWEILDRLGADWRRVNPPAGLPTYGLARVQWEGPWTKPDVPMRARYRHTHWIGAAWSVGRNEFGVFDVNAMANGTGWCDASDWAHIIVPWILNECVPKADGRWHLTHVVEIALPGQARGGAR